MRTYLILKHKASLWNEDREIQSLVRELSIGHAGLPAVDTFSRKQATALLDHVFDRNVMMERKLCYEKLDQLTMDLLLGAR